MDDFAELRTWIQFFFIIIGGTIGLFSFIQHAWQRRIENAFKMITWIQSILVKGEINHWKNLFLNSSVSTGAKPGNYISINGKEHSIGDYYQEGAPDAGSIARLTDLIEVVCFAITQKTVDKRIMWFELGQIIDSLFFWLSHINSSSEGRRLIEDFPSIKKVVSDNALSRNLKIPYKTIAFIE
ncbi:MAG: hypothetical protein AB7H80_04915 [Candidatus Kapaibacterium sp.]